MTCPYCRAEATRKITKDCVIHKCPSCKSWQQYIAISHWPEAQRRFCPEEVQETTPNLFEE